MRISSTPAGSPSPMRLLEMLSDRFGAFEAAANSTVKLARFATEDELSMDLLMAQAVLEFGADLRAASTAAREWGREIGLVPLGSADSE